jgi:hypothetical protein
MKFINVIAFKERKITYKIYRVFMEFMPGEERYDMPQKENPEARVKAAANTKDWKENVLKY